VPLEISAYAQDVRCWLRGGHQVRGCWASGAKQLRRMLITCPLICKELQATLLYITYLPTYLPTYLLNLPTKRARAEATTPSRRQTTTARARAFCRSGITQLPPLRIEIAFGVDRDECYIGGFNVRYTSYRLDLLLPRIGTELVGAVGAGYDEKIDWVERDDRVERS
jgi:hypothetical protein